ncbi:DNA-directed RNA polymerase subunit beta' [Candidatus Johnevansia muelleri]|uniref:DNA-directed RNA polymerase subunit beta' n=1 Tax=Candidatus Johnevansia muelleri TaxID=1495769 RepID=A0A078KB07_9GAMM|nr:DNA-directed RNA polymerase subunit beta' [Candidatus Evansia muelleri]
MNIFKNANNKLKINFEKTKKFQKQLESFNYIKISLASPKIIESWSFGEIKTSDTINYRTLKPEHDGLFCTKIFGPVVDYECWCGKYNHKMFPTVICEKCNVEIIKAKSRRERMGHINLFTPVAHIWFIKSQPNMLSLLLNMSIFNIERVIYYESFIVLNPGITPLQKGQLLTNNQYSEARKEFNDEFEADMGAKAIKKLLIDINIDMEIFYLKKYESNLKNYNKLKVLQAFKESGNNPDWMILDVIPVLPPDLRPLLPLEGGRFANSDINDLYRNIIHRNNRLKKLFNIQSPDIIIKNEKRMLQEAVDALIDNGRNGRMVTNNKRPLKSIANLIKGKQGRFRQNLLGKRVDYSGRTVITVGPKLRLYQCGLPKKMALELFKPFVFSILQSYEKALTIQSAKKSFKLESKEVWDALKTVIKDHPIILNRAPTLHRLGIQAFEPVLIEEKAIKLHPLVCSAYNADFDGDQMAVHIPLTLEAQLEARTLLMSSNNLLSPANGTPIIVPSQDIVLGLYYMTHIKIHAKGEGLIFSNIDEIESALNTKKIDLHAIIKVRICEWRRNKNTGVLRKKCSIYQTTVGRALLFRLLPHGIEFELVNKPLKKKAISKLINAVYRRSGIKETVIISDKLMEIGFNLATFSGTTIGVDDLIIPNSKKSTIDYAENTIKNLNLQFNKGLITENEKYNKTIDVWLKTNETIAKNMMGGISKEIFINKEGINIQQYSFQNIFIIADSGARGSETQIRQIAGMRGLMAKPDGSIIETPIKANFREGLTVLEYFISTHGARKGLADTALKTANSGYLTRRLVDVSQDVVITEINCGSQSGLSMESIIDGSNVLVSLSDRVLGRVLSRDIVDSYNNVLIIKNTLIDETLCKKIDYLKIRKIWVRSILTCNTMYGACAMCYGRDLARGSLVNVGEPVGVIAAQSIGEPGTQLTMRTFHFGGAVSRSLIIDSITVKYGGIVKFNNIKLIYGVTNILVSRYSSISILDEEFNLEIEYYKVPYGAEIFVNDAEHIDSGRIIAKWDPYMHPIITEFSGKVKFVNMEEGVTISSIVYENTISIRILYEKNRPYLGSYKQPRIILLDKNDNPVMYYKSNIPVQYILPGGAIVLVINGLYINSGYILARIPIDLSVNKDITGGLTRVANIFEARRPQNAAILAEMSGTVTFGNEIKGKRNLIITPDKGDPYESLLPISRNLNVLEGEIVKKGEIISDGLLDPHDILRLLGISELSKHITNEIQEVYRLQGVSINDKHIEVIIRQMLSKVEIIDPGDSEFLKGEKIEFLKVIKKNLILKKNNMLPIKYNRIILGITKASLITESFISAASFQETTRILIDAALAGKCDYLKGLKENVIVGRLIPAGTGLMTHQKF